MILTSIGYNLARLLAFSGRESRRLYWPYAITVFLAGMVAGLVLMVPVMMDMWSHMVAYIQQHPEGLPKPAPGQPPVLPRELMPDFGQLRVPLGILNLVSLFLYAAATVRRLHDRDRAGWWALLPVPFQVAGFLAGPAALRAMTEGGGAPSLLSALSGINSLLYWLAFILLIVMLAGEGTRGPNRFGEAPPA